MATVKIGRASDNEAKPTQKAKQTFYADAEGNVTTDSANAALHLTNKGEDILPHIAAKYGFVDGDVPAKASKAEAKATAPAENKAVETKSDINVADNRPGANKVEVKKK